MSYLTKYTLIFTIIFFSINTIEGITLNQIQGSGDSGINSNTKISMSVLAKTKYIGMWGEEDYDVGNDTVSENISLKGLTEGDVLEPGTHVFKLQWHATQPHSTKVCNMGCHLKFETEDSDGIYQPWYLKFWNSGDEAVENFVYAYACVAELATDIAINGDEPAGYIADANESISMFTNTFYKGTTAAHIVNTYCEMMEAKSTVTGGLKEFEKSQIKNAVNHIKWSIERRIANFISEKNGGTGTWVKMNVESDKLSFNNERDHSAYEYVKMGGKLTYYAHIMCGPRWHNNYKFGINENDALVNIVIAHDTGIGNFKLNKTRKAMSIYDDKERKYMIFSDGEIGYVSGESGHYSYTTLLEDPDWHGVPTGIGYGNGTLFAGSSDGDIYRVLYNDDLSTADLYKMHVSLSLADHNVTIIISDPNGQGVYFGMDNGGVWYVPNTDGYWDNSGVKLFDPDNMNYNITKTLSISVNPNPAKGYETKAAAVIGMANPYPANAKLYKLYVIDRTGKSPQSISTRNFSFPSNQPDSLYTGEGDIKVMLNNNFMIWYAYTGGAGYTGADSCIFYLSLNNLDSNPKSISVAMPLNDSSPPPMCAGTGGHIVVGTAPFGTKNNNITVFKPGDEKEVEVSYYTIPGEVTAIGNYGTYRYFLGNGSGEVYCLLSESGKITKMTITDKCSSKVIGFDFVNGGGHNLGTCHYANGESSTFNMPIIKNQVFIVGSTIAEYSDVYTIKGAYHFSDNTTNNKDVWLLRFDSANSMLIVNGVAYVDTNFQDIEIPSDVYSSEFSGSEGKYKCTINGNTYTYSNKVVYYYPLK